MKVLSHKDLHCRDFGSSLLSVPDFFAWLKANRLWIVTNPDIKNYDFVQVESLLCAVERAAGEITDAEAQEIVDADPFLAADLMAKAAPRWLVGADAHRKWRIKLTQAISDDEIFLLDFGSKLPIALPAAAVLAAVLYGSPPIETKPQAVPADNKPILQADTYANTDETLAALFDPVTVPVLEKMFPTNGKWAKWAERAKRNGLAEAKSSQAMFNPYRAGLWFLRQGIAGWDLARCNRTLANSLPARSRSDRYLLTGELE